MQSKFLSPQCKQLLAFLRANGPKSTNEIREATGIPNVSQRISDLRARGYRIDSYRSFCDDGHGSRRCFAVYSLQREPQESIPYPATPVQT